MTTTSLSPFLMPRLTWHPAARPHARAMMLDDHARRALNVLVAALGIIITAPLMAVIALLVRLTSPGPVIYRQTRVGIDRRTRRSTEDDADRARDLGGRPFVMYKFRTMRHVPPQATSSHVWATPGDARVTSVGRVLRAFRLDELPQLFNVLIGDMNVVGPRPEQPDIFARLRTELHGYVWRQGVAPGITGWAQIHLGYDRTMDDARRKLEYDLDYIRRRSWLADLRIMLRTFPVMLGRRGGW